jgi:hypothetical protein
MLAKIPRRSLLAVAEKYTPAERSELARRAAKARWAKRDAEK